MSVVCNQTNYCTEPMCGGKQPHDYDKNECGRCPKNPNAKCIEVPVAEGKTP